MGWDVSYHPVDVELFEERLIPFVRGKGSLDDLIERAVRILQVRFRANAWGLAVLNLQEQQFARQRSKKKGAKTSTKKAKTTKSATAGASVPEIPERFESDLCIWGRPYFITLESPEDVSRAIDGYLAADVKEADGIAREMVRLLDPALVKHVKPSSQKPGPEKALFDNYRQMTALWRDWYQCFKKKKPVLDAQGDPHDARDALASREFLHLLFAFAANFRPGWMGRGYVWPSLLLAEAKLRPRDYLVKPTSLVGPLVSEVPQIKETYEDSITENFMVGGFVPAKKVAALRTLFREKSASHLADPELEIDLRKLDEALYDAQRRGLAFAEAAEIYSGPMGLMN